MSRWKCYAVVGLVAAIVMLTNLGGPRLWDRDEPRNAGCAAEMLARGDWIVPVFNGELRTHKPVLLYWLMMASYSVLGISEFSARLPSALLAIGTALCTYEMARHLFSWRAGIWAGIAVATSLMFVVAGRAATPDATLIFCSTLSITLFALGIPKPEAKAQMSHPHGQVALSWMRAAGIFGAMSLATLAKGPIGILLPTTILVLFQLLSAPRGCDSPPRGWRERFLDTASKFTPQRIVSAAWQLRPLTALSIALVIAVPWYICVGLKTDGEFLRGFFLEHNFGRALSAMEGHRGNILFYPVTMLIGLFPWSIFAIPVLIDLWQQIRRRHGLPAGYLLGACWLGVYLGVFSLAKTKLPSYVTPAYPAVAILIGTFLDRWITGQIAVPRFWLQAASGVLASVGVVLTAGIPFAVHDRLPGAEFLGVIGLVPLIAGIWAWWEIRRDQPRRAAWCVAGAATAFATLLFAVGADQVDRHQLSHRLLQAIDNHSARPRVAAYACLEPSWVFYGGRPIDELSEGQVGPTHSPFVATNNRWQPKPKVTIANIIATGPDALIITTGQQLANLQRLLPPGFQVLETVPLFLKKDNLVLLGRPKSARLAEHKSTEVDGPK